LKPAALVLLVATGALAEDYDGKYKADARLAAVRGRLPGMLREARTKIRVDGSVRVELRDLGKTRRGIVAKTVQDADGFVIVLYTEPLVLRMHAVAATLRHELVHCLQKERWGARGEVTTPLWIKEGMAVYLSGQLEVRERALAAHVGREPVPADAVARLVNGLDGRHTLLDYAEDGVAFAGAAKRHGAKKAQQFIDLLLAGVPPREATVRALGERWEAFAASSQKYARARLDPLVREGRPQLLALRAAVEAEDYDTASSLPAATGVYAADDAYYRARALRGLKRPADALKLLRARLLSTTPRTTTLLPLAVALEVELLAELKRSPEHAIALRNSRLDLEPFTD